MRTVNLDVKLEEHGFLWLLKYKNKNQKHVGYIYSKIQILFFLRRTLQEEKSKKNPGYIPGIHHSFSALRQIGDL